MKSGAADAHILTAFPMVTGGEPMIFQAYGAIQSNNTAENLLIDDTKLLASYDSGNDGLHGSLRPYLVAAHLFVTFSWRDLQLIDILVVQQIIKIISPLLHIRFSSLSQQNEHRSMYIWLYSGDLLVKLLRMIRLVLISPEFMDLLVLACFLLLLPARRISFQVP